MSRAIPLQRLALWALALFVFSIPSENAVSIPGVGSLTRLLGVFAFSMGAVSLFARGRFRFRAPSLFLIVTALFLVWCVATYFWSVVPQITLGRATTYAQLAVLVWLVHQLVRDERDLALLHQAFVLGCYVLMGVGFAAYFGGGGGFRNVGGFNANGFAIISALGIPLAWSLAVRSSHGVWRLLNIVYPLFAMAAVVLAASRGGLLTAIVALLIVPVLLGRLRAGARVALFVVLAAVAWGGFTLLPTLVPDLERNIERLAQTDEELLGGGTLTGRTDIWAAGLEILWSAPIVGVGMGGFNAANYALTGSGKSAHNAFLSVAVGSGLVGLFLYVGLIAVAFVGIVANPARRAEHLVLLFALLVAFLPTNSENDKFTWFILGAFAAVRPVLVSLGVAAYDAPPLPQPKRSGTRPSLPPRRTMS